MLNSLYKLFEHKCVFTAWTHSMNKHTWLCVWSVCTHPSYNDKIHPADEIMNIAVVSYSWHLNRWRCRGLMFLSFWGREGEGNAPIPDLPKCVNVRANHSWSSFIYRRSKYKGFYESLQIAFPNNVLVSLFSGWSLVCSMDLYIPRCLIVDCFYGPWYMSHPPFLEWSANLWVHWLCASTTASYMLVYIWIFLDYYGECEWLMRQRMWSGRIGIYTNLWSAGHAW